MSPSNSETQFIINFEFFGFLRSINCIIERNLRLFVVEGFRLSGSCSFSLYLFSKSDWILFGSFLYGNFFSRFWCLDFLGRLLFMYGSFCNGLWLLCDCFLSLRLNLGLMHLLCLRVNMFNLLCCWCFNVNVISNVLFQIGVILFQCFFQSVSSFKSFLSLL